MIRDERPDEAEDGEETCANCMQPLRRCRCDRDDRNPVDMSAQDWREWYAAHPDFDIADDLEP